MVDFQAVPHNSHTNLHSQQQCTKVFCAPHSCYVFHLFDRSHSNKGEVIFIVVLICISLMFRMLSDFSCTYCSFVCLLSEMSVHVLCPFLKDFNYYLIFDIDCLWCMCVCVHVSLCVFICVVVYVHVCLCKGCMHMYVHVGSICICECIHVSVY